MPDRRTLIAQLNQIYSAHRSALLNRKYYAHRLSSYQKMNRATEILLVVATSGAVGSWAIWQFGLIRPFWSAIIGLAAVISIVKPLLQWPQQIERCSRLVEVPVVIRPQPGGRRYDAGTVVFRLRRCGRFRDLVFLLRLVPTRGRS